MSKEIFLKSNNINLIKVTNSTHNIKILYGLLKKREKKRDISHKKLPSFKEHEYFVNASPYRFWFLIYKNKEIMGSIYITKLNEISIKLIKNSKLVYKETLNTIIKNIKPLKPIPSKRNSNFIINIAPNDKYYVTLLSKIGAKKIQETFQLNMHINSE